MVAFCDISPNVLRRQKPISDVITRWYNVEILIASREAGKHVLCEKPMAKTTEEARVMIDASKRTGKKLTIGYQNRFR